MPPFYFLKLSIVLRILDGIISYHRLYLPVRLALRCHLEKDPVRIEILRKQFIQAFDAFFLLA